MPSPVRNALSPAMMAAYVDLKRGPLIRTRHAYLSANDNRHHSNAIVGLVERRLAMLVLPRPGHSEAVLTPLGSMLRLDATESEE